MDILISLLILALILWLAVWIIDSFLPLPANIKMIAKVVVGVIGLIALFRMIQGSGYLNF